jgi:hypothetical protein
MGPARQGSRPHFVQVLGPRSAPGQDRPGFEELLRVLLYLRVLTGPQADEECPEDLLHLLVFAKGADDCVSVHVHRLPDEFGQEHEPREIALHQ